MAVGESLKNSLFKIELFLLKILPILLAFCNLLNTVLSYFYIDCYFLSYLAGVSVLTLIFMYVSSYVFKFCAYHRMFLHYVAIDNIITIYDYYIGIPVDDKELFLINIGIAGITLFVILYLYVKHHKKVVRNHS